MKIKTINWLLVFVWAGFIFFLSHQPDLKSGLSHQWDFIFRKLAHITEYAILTLLLFRVISQYKLSERKILILVFVFALFYALTDEYHQSFILGRQATFRDVLIDSIGILLIVSWSVLRSKRLLIKKR
ncbi:MAG: hypothetical protein CMI55_03540 [Parcubacteria group bacterium]|jgi:VanZ family protein|nr:hypothetical protein [Parcubacteria group bacterium]|tara:strand:+ start:201 stop:584 length:384 start_codon:yes stop_codon:yes gene_type:complete